MTVTRRIRVSIEDIYVDDIVERGAIEIDAEVVRGDSGGAVIRADGEVIGLIYATSRSRAAGFALNDDELRAVLDATAEAPVDSGPCL
jgi:S1-C subfamily serine protease